MSEFYFGKISKKYDPGQLTGGYYVADKNSSWFNGLQIKDYVLMVGGDKVQFWRAKKYNGDRMEFDIIIDDCGIKPQKLASLVYFYQDMELIVKSMRSTTSEKKAFFKMNPLPKYKSKLVSLLRNKKSYTASYLRNIVLYVDYSELQKDANNRDNDIQLYYENDEIKIVKKGFIDEQLLDSFDGNLKSKNFEEEPKKKKNKIRKKFELNGAKTKIVDASMLDFYDVFISKQTTNVSPFKKELSDDSNKVFYNDDEARKPPLNLILYGPPGTGKTYSTLFHTLAIIENRSVDEVIREKEDYDKKGEDGYKKLKEKYNYDELVKSGQIVFTTFHQSMSYEDFIEGIKPEPINDEVIAVHEYDNNNATKITQFGNGKTTVKNLSRMKYEVKDGIFKKLCDIRVFLKDAKNKNVKFDLENGNIFTIDKIEEAIVYCKNSLSGEVPVGIEEIFTLLKKNNKPKQEEEQKQEQSHLFAIAIVKKFLEKKKVIIIDEINRGNVAQIFGELITLIEDNKRLGNDEAMTATLPYSQEPFGVPNNLYIIGTMNTADRSVEALDTALRRRFSFVEMMPDSELLKDKDRKYLEVCGIKLSDLLKTINARIAVLKDREHQIGHSYYMKCKTWKDLKDAFRKGIIPLLQEYFYGNYESIRLVLGEGFVVKETEKVIFAGGQSYDGDSDKTRYRLLTESEWGAMDENKLKIAIEKLLNKTNNLDAPDGTSSIL